MDAIHQLGMGTDVKLLLQYTKRPWLYKVGETAWSGGMEHTDPNFETWESSTDEAGKAGLITVYAGGSGSATFTNDEPHGVAPQPLVDTILGHIDDVVPGTAYTFNGKAWLDYWTGDPWTLALLRRVRARPDDEVLGLQRDPGRPRPLRRRAHVDVLARVPQRRRRVGPAGGDRGDARDRCARAEGHRVDALLAGPRLGVARSTNLPSSTIRRP